MPEMTEVELIEAYRVLWDRYAALQLRAEEISKIVKPLNSEREKALLECGNVQSEKSRLESIFKRLTGRDIKKAVRDPVEVATERAHGELMHAITGESPLPFTDPIVIKRLAAYRDAVVALSKFRAEKRKARQARGDSDVKNGEKGIEL